MQSIPVVGNGGVLITALKSGKSLVGALFF